MNSYKGKSAFGVLLSRSFLLFYLVGFVFSLSALTLSSAEAIAGDKKTYSYAK